jgi:hypothetical protein
MKFFASVISLFILNMDSVFSQDNLLVNFTARQIENYVHLNFTVEGGITCLGTKVQRSIDDVHYETIGTIPGICGGTEDQNYFFDDSFPLKNQLNYYRIDLNQYGISNSVSAQFVDYGDGFVVIQNPATKNFTVLFSNFNNQKIDFTLYNLNGIVLNKVSTNSNNITFLRAAFPSGIYFLEIKNEDQNLSVEKIILQ